MGLGSACGAFLGGLLYEWHGPALMFQWAGLAVLVGLVIFVVMERWLNRPNPAAEVGL
jgi:predicted MFS family arabinose efflux permease